ncbi:RDD family protein [Solilutibacter tolerans]|uniref:Uncharacterized membrane protein YckC, RDD family n=1 Tax=Solilutibacter tolerans TaxID=1604334 RepID=A0A1N6SCN6_9GAMM|nr:RDD family protein [Lysobacter tolerans]SIQ38831.1 Uncharacterized membrane protein YckC, RDD family [Lysobacter tolerans]
MSETAHDQEWFYVDAGRQQQGPVSGEDLRFRYARGELRADTLVWQAGMSEWQPLRQAMALPATPANTLEDPLPSTASIMAPGTEINRTDIAYAGFWRRVAAYQLDSFIVGIASYFVIIPFAMVIGMDAQMSSLEHGDDPSAVFGSLLPMLALMYLLIFALQAVYFAWMHSRPAQATLGKMAVGIKVANADGSRIGFSRGLLRWLGLFLSALPLGIGFLMAAFTERKRALHDMACDTVVVDRWAYTNQPELQERGLDGVTIAILIIFGLMTLFGLAMMALLVAALTSGQWN